MVDRWLYKVLQQNFKLVLLVGTAYLRVRLIPLCLRWYTIELPPLNEVKYWIIGTETILIKDQGKKGVFN